MFGAFQSLNQSPSFHVYTGSVAQMPLWARVILGIITLPGILFVVLCLLLFLVSILALLILAIPPYIFLRWLTGVKVRQVVEEGYTFDQRGRSKKVDVTVLK